MLPCIQTKVTKDHQESIQQYFTLWVLTVHTDQMSGNPPHSDPDKDCEEGFLDVRAKRRFHLTRPAIFVNHFIFYSD